MGRSNDNVVREIALTLVPSTNALMNGLSPASLTAAVRAACGGCRPSVGIMSFLADLEP